MIDKTAAIPRTEHPRPDFQRDGWYCLNGIWDFRFDPEDSGKREEWSKGTAEFKDRIAVPFSWASPLSGIARDIKGIGWYRRTVIWNPQEEDAHIFLRFGAADYSCEVWVNGIPAGSHTGGYSTFEFDVTDYWRDGENCIVIRVEDFDLDYQTRGKQGYGEIRGIWQPVWLEARPKSFIQSLRFITHIDGKISVSGEINSSGSVQGRLIFSFDENSIKHETEMLQLVPGTNSFNTVFTVPSPRLWSPDEPNLYEGTVTFSVDDCAEACSRNNNSENNNSRNSSIGINHSSDIVSTYFGIREIGIGNFEGREYPWITLNGRPVFLNGTLDQSFNPQGYFTYPSDNEMRNEIWRLKRLGLNFVRIHIKPEEPRKLYWADKLGILVMEDMPCFWGEPGESAREAHRQQAYDTVCRDFNHPSIVFWVMFNETWGLLSGDANGSKAYTRATQEWVRETYRWAKKLDPSRLVEDNSPCNLDHVESDINSWHFYVNGYYKLRDHLRHTVENTYKGSAWNYIGGNVQNGAPLMNSECGAVWGIEGSAGDSDIAWHYRYMINEFRKYDKLCGFIFTEFHDVVNEYNGYYRIDNKDKDFGYEWFCEGMTIADLHSPDFIVIDAPPCQTVKTGSTTTVKFLASSFSDRFRGQQLQIEWELWYDALGTKRISDSGTLAYEWKGYGVRPVCPIDIGMPSVDAAAVLSVKLKSPEGEVLSRNFITFDVRSGAKSGKYDTDAKVLSISPSGCECRQWEYSWEALGGSKLNGGFHGRFEYDVQVINQMQAINEVQIIFEAGAKTVLFKDKEMITRKPSDLSYMHGAKEDPGMNVNSYIMTDEKKQPTTLQVIVDDEVVDTFVLPDDPADSRGILSWHYQQDDGKLDEAGSYGYLCRVKLPSRLLPGISAKGHFRLAFRVPEGLPEGHGGLALYGRNAGRYPIDILIICR